MSRLSRWHGRSAGALAVLVLGTLATGACSSGDSSDNDATRGVLELACPDQPNGGDLCEADCTTTCGYTRQGQPLGVRYCVCQSGVFVSCPCDPGPGWLGAETAPYCDHYTGLPVHLRGDLCPGAGVQCVGDEPSGGAAREGCNCLAVTLPSGGQTAQWACGPIEMLGIPTTAQSCHEFENGDGRRMNNDPCTTEWDLCISREYVSGTTPRGCVCLDQGGGRLEWSCTSTQRWFRPE